MNTEQVTLMSDPVGEVTTTQPAPPAYSPGNPDVMVKGTVHQSGRPVDPDMNMVYLSIFTMLFCCWPCGVVGLIYGLQGMQQYYRGEYDQSEKTNKTSKIWTICGIVSGVVYIVSIVFIVIIANVVRVIVEVTVNN